MYGCWWFTPRQSVVAQSNGGTTENGARRKVGCLSSIGSWEDVEERRQNGHEVPLIWVGKGEEGREREMISMGKASRALYPYNELPPTSRTAPATPYSPSFTYRRSCVNVFDDLNLLKSLNRKKTDCRQTVSDCQTLRRSTTSGIEEVLCHKRRH